MSREATWNHTEHYHALALDALPTSMERCIDVGCGDGQFTRKLQALSNDVWAIDRDAGMIALVQSNAPELHAIEADFLDYELPPRSFDAVTFIMSLHHFDFVAAIHKARSLLRPNGTLVLLGLGRRAGLGDMLLDAVGVVMSRFMRLSRGYRQQVAPISQPTMSYQALRAAVHAELPGATFRRLLLFRYLVTWRQTEDAVI